MGLFAVLITVSFCIDRYAKGGHEEKSRKWNGME